LNNHGKAKLLVVDDEYFNFTLYAQALGQQYQLQYVDSGKQCLNEAINQHPDAIMLDVCMPGLDGFDTCRMLKNTPETQDIPVLMISGLESPHAKQQGYAAGCDAYFVKPLSFNELLDSLQTLI
tara:strand:- start:4 stop:375 length:372 start_codon:yes stop_codon:yes gene_type:complete